MSKLIQSTYESWKDLNYPQLMKDLDEIATEIAEGHNQSEISRKSLIEKNKDFKDKVSLEARKEVAPLLKCFQQEIDNFTKLNKKLETHILTLYKRFVDLPDPLESFEMALANQKRLSKMQDLVLENNQLRESVEAFQKEISEVKNQEVTVKQLRERIKDLESTLHSSIDIKFREKERELQSIYAEKEREILAENKKYLWKSQDYEIRLNESDKKLVDIQSEYFQTKNKLDEISYAKSSELELLLSENDRMNQQIKQLESQLESLTQSLELTSQSQPDSSCDEPARHQKKLLVDQNHLMSYQHELEDLQSDLAIKDKQIQQLIEDKRKLNHKLTSESDEYIKQIAELQNQLTHQSTTIDQLKHQLQQQDDYSEIKRELGIIKSIEFTEEDYTTGDSPLLSPLLDQLQHQKNPDFTRKSLDQLLFSKNKRLENLLLKEKSAHQKINELYKSLMQECEDHRQTVSIQKKLIDKLEEDLNHIYNRKTVADTVNSEDDTGNKTMVVSSDMNFSPIASNKKFEAEILANVMEGTIESNSNSDNISTDENNKPKSNSLLSIVQNQRDRFKKRALDLEEANQISQKHIQTMSQEIEQIKRDNVKLYEKVRYLQSYERRNEYTQEDKSLSQYSNQYEAGLNPFESFHRRERQNQYNILPPHEKIMFSLGQFILGNRIGRLVAFVYSIILHLLIFLVLYKLAYTQDCVRDQALDCQRKFADHMLKAHGGHK